MNPRRVVGGRSPRSPEAGDETIRTAMNALRRIVRALRLGAVEVEREVGISVAQLFVLQSLADGSARSINDLAALTVTDPSTVSGVVRRLVDAGLVHRGTSADDARRADLSLTRRGKELLARAPTAPQKTLVAALAELPPRRRREVAHGLAELADGLGGGAPALFFENEAPARRPR